ncbi:MAG: hypothetical protein KAI66_03595, partial [Lentisphaeria bacterium]|nr:hypothetical protein [Lentisphaeria bacterium]
MRLHSVFLACVTMMAAFSCAAADDRIEGIPLKPDPPFAVDGDLSDWADVPGGYVLKDEAQVIFGRGSWTTPADLSGTVRIAWRHDNLFVAANVSDEQLRQTQRGDGIWQGDHIELYLDAQPDLEPTRDIFGAGQFHLAFSPGNFLRTGDALTDCAPEAFCFRPQGTSVEGVKVGAKRTEAGWTLEAAIPWKILGITRPKKGMTLRFEIAISDTDAPGAKQECMMTISTERWHHARSRLALAGLAGTDGVPPVIVRGVSLFDEARLEQGAKKTFAFTAPPLPEGRDAVLVLNARMHTPKVAGHHPALHLVLNGKGLPGKRFVNKPMRVPARGGPVYSMASGERLTTYYSPDFTKPDMHPYYGLLNGVKACDFELRVTDLLREGENELLVENQAHPRVQRTLVAANARIEFRMPPPPEKQRRAAPTGPLPTIEPRRKLVADYKVAQPADEPAVLRLRIGGETCEVRSRFSTPAPKWVTGTNTYFRHKRRIERKGEAVIVHDTFTNLTAKNLAIMQRHEIDFGKTLKRVWLA